MQVSLPLGTENHAFFPLVVSSHSHSPLLMGGNTQTRATCWCPGKTLGIMVMLGLWTAPNEVFSGLFALGWQLTLLVCVVPPFSLAGETEVTWGTEWFLPLLKDLTSISQGFLPSSRTLNIHWRSCGKVTSKNRVESRSTWVWGTPCTIMLHEPWSTLPSGRK